MKKYLLIAMAVLAIASCSEKKYHVEGTISNAKDSLLLFENVGIEEITVVDSIRLDENGTFNFSGAAQEAPEFYRLRIAGQIINVSIDSTETVTVKADYPQMATAYEISGSDNCLKIKELALKQIDLRQRAIAISENEGLTVKATNDSIYKIVNQYKEDIKKNYIYAEPSKAYAYFALFQTLGDMLLFNPRANREDIKAFAAVATSWDSYYPNSARGANLHNIAIEGMNNIRINDAARAQTIDTDTVRSAGISSPPRTHQHASCCSASSTTNIMLKDWKSIRLALTPTSTSGNSRLPHCLGSVSAKTMVYSHRASHSITYRAFPTSSSSTAATIS